MFTPHARGSTDYCRIGRIENPVYPACAGIDLYDSEQDLRRYCLPRMRGDRPDADFIAQAREGFTPHARGSTTLRWQQTGLWYVYPACAGIDLQQ